MNADAVPVHRLSRAASSHRRQYARVGPAEVHADYRPDGIAPRLGHALATLAAESEQPFAGPHAHLAAGILRSGDHGLLPIFADALQEAGHPLHGEFDWRHAPRAIAIDRALRQSIAARNYRVRGRNVRPLDITDVLPEWRTAMFSGRPTLSRRQALNEVRREVPDATPADVAHSAVRLHDLWHVAYDSRLAPQTDPRNRTHMRLPENGMQESHVQLAKAYLYELNQPAANPLTYPDPRTPRSRRRKLSRLRDVIRLARGQGPVADLERRPDSHDARRALADVLDAQHPEATVVAQLLRSHPHRVRVTADGVVPAGDRVAVLGPFRVHADRGDGFIDVAAHAKGLGRGRLVIAARLSHPAREQPRHWTDAVKTPKPTEAERFADALGEHGDGFRAMLAESPERYAAWRSPKGGSVVRGTFYPGGALIPDPQRFAAKESPPSLRQRLRDLIASLRVRRRTAKPEEEASSR